MRKLILPTLAVVVIGTILGGVYVRRGQAQFMTLRYNIKDLPEHGLIIIAPSNQLFATEVSSIFGGTSKDSNKDVKTIQAFGVFLKNISNQEVVAYKLKWELLNSDGEVSVKYTSTINPAKLTGEVSPEIINAGGGIIPDTSLFVTWDQSLAKLLYSRRRNRDSIDSPAARKVTAAMSQVGAAMREQLKSAISMTVTLDGAFFADGTFVGPDEDNTFDEVQAYMDSEQDIARLIEDGKKGGKDTNSIIDHIEHIFKNTNVTPTPHPTRAHYKTLFTKMRVASLLKLRGAQDADLAVNEALGTARKQRIRLKKIQ